MAAAETAQANSLAPQTDIAQNETVEPARYEALQRDERGRADRWVAGTLAAAALGGVAYIGAGPFAHASGIAYALQNIGTEQSVDGSNSEINAEFALGQKLELTCASLNMWHVSEDTKVRVKTEIKVGSKTFSPDGLYSDFSFYNKPDDATKKKDPNAGKTVVAVVTCNDDSKGDPVSVQHEAPTDPNAKFGESVVTLNTANMSTIATMPQQNPNRFDGTLTAALDGGIQGSSAAFRIACLPFKLAGVPCDDIAKKFTPDMTTKAETMGQVIAENAVLEATAKEGSKAAWEKQTLPQFLDYIAGEALKKGGVEALKSVHVKVEGGAPDFDKTNMFKNYGGDALAKEGIGIKLDTKNTKVNITVDENYVPENYASIHKATDGTYVFDPIPEGAS